MIKILISTSFAMFAVSGVGSLACAQNSSEAGQMVYIDPETGEISKKLPSPEERLKLPQQNQAIIDNANNEMNFIQMSNGGTKIELNGRFQKTLNAVIDENGELETGHHIQIVEDNDMEKPQ